MELASWCFLKADTMTSLLASTHSVEEEGRNQIQSEWWKHTQNVEEGDLLIWIDMDHTSSVHSVCM